jgi:hypothetical protein
MSIYEFSLAITKALKKKWGYAAAHDVRHSTCLDFSSLDNILPALRWIEELLCDHDPATNGTLRAEIKIQVWGGRVCYELDCLHAVEWHGACGKGATDREAAMNLLAELCCVAVEESEEDYHTEGLGDA